MQTSCSGSYIEEWQSWIYIISKFYFCGDHHAKTSGTTNIDLLENCSPVVVQLSIAIAIWEKVAVEKEFDSDSQAWTEQWIETASQ